MDLLNSVTSYLPADEGLLPKWLLFLSVTSLFNTVQCYFTLHFNRQIYNGVPKPSSSNTTAAYPPQSPATPLSSRTFATWTLLASLIRLSASYHITNPQVYQLAYATFVVAWIHFMSEWLIFGTVALGRGSAGPLVVSNLSLVWMWLVWGDYVA